MDTDSHRPRDEPENQELHRQFPADPAHERKGLLGEDEVPEHEEGRPDEHGGEKERGDHAPKVRSNDEGA